MNEEKKIRNRRKGAYTALATFITIGLMLTFVTGIPWLEQGDDSDWNVVFRGGLSDVASAEMSQPDRMGFLGFWLSDHDDIVPATDFANNATDWSANTSSWGYVDTDDFNEEIRSEDPFYVACKCVFNETTKDSGSWNHSRYRVTLWMSGDDNIGNVSADVNSTYSVEGDAVVSDFQTNQIYMVFWWDTGVGYNMTDDGQLTVHQILVEARY